MSKSKKIQHYFRHSQRREAGFSRIRVGNKAPTQVGFFQPRLYWSFQVVSDLRKLGNGNKWLRLLRLCCCVSALSHARNLTARNIRGRRFIDTLSAPSGKMHPV
ncbi:hypothetical protein AOLI_G00007140 [Acnodon oligacanthus]